MRKQQTPLSEKGAELSLYEKTVDAAVQFAAELGFTPVETALVLGFEIYADNELHYLLKQVKLYRSFDVEERVQKLVILRGAIGELYHKENFPTKMREVHRDLEDQSLHELLTSGDIGDFVLAIMHFEQIFGGKIS